MSFCVNEGLELSNNKIRKVLEKCYLCGEIGDSKNSEKWR